MYRIIIYRLDGEYVNSVERTEEHLRWLFAGVVPVHIFQPQDGAVYWKTSEAKYIFIKL